MTVFRFYFNVFVIELLKSVIATCRCVERFIYAKFFATDRLGVPSPLPTLVKPVATKWLRVDVLVLDIGFLNLVLLEGDIATTDATINGRLDVVLGSSHMKWGYSEDNITFDAFVARARRLR